MGKWLYQMIQIAANTIFSLYSKSTAKNTVISLDFLVLKFCGKAQFPHSFGRIVRNYEETVLFRKISTLGNQMKLRYFSQWSSCQPLSIALDKSKEPPRTSNVGLEHKALKMLWVIEVSWFMHESFGVNHYWLLFRSFFFSFFEKCKDTDKN